MRDPRAVRALAVGLARGWLTPFFEGEHSISEVDHALGLKVKPLANQVRALHQLGLLEQTRVQARKGRTIAYYRTSAEEFFIPAEALPLEVLERGEAQYLRQFIEGLIGVWGERPRADHVRYGFRVHTDGAQTAFNFAAGPGQAWDLLDPESPAFFTSWAVLELGPENAKSCQREMYELLRRYQARSIPGKTRYLTRSGLVKLVEE